MPFKALNPSIGTCDVPVTNCTCLARSSWDSPAMKDQYHSARDYAGKKSQNMGGSIAREKRDGIRSEAGAPRG
jgi:hypothetical protein